jgi:hypothetical protein
MLNALAHRTLAGSGRSLRPNALTALGATSECRLMADLGRSVSAYGLFSTMPR